jgi:hypothetical protein
MQLWILNCDMCKYFDCETNYHIFGCTEHSWFFDKYYLRMAIHLPKHIQGFKIHLTLVNNLVHLLVLT